MEAGNPIISLFFAPNVFFFPLPVSCRLAGEKVDELQRCGQGHRIRSGRDVQLQEAAAFVRCLFCCFLAEMIRNTHLKKLIPVLCLSSFVCLFIVSVQSHSTNHVTTFPVYM